VSFGLFWVVLNSTSWFRASYSVQVTLYTDNSYIRYSSLATMANNSVVFRILHAKDKLVKTSCISYITC